MAITAAWDETDPADSDNISQGAQEIRDAKRDVRERCEVDHVWNVDTTHDGKHNSVTLRVQASDPTNTNSEFQLYSKDVSAKAELFMQDEDDNVLQLTSGGQFLGAVPVGGIIMWSGTIATIPSNWALCDGTSGTPDLRDRFIVGARQDDAGAAKTNLTGSLTISGGSRTSASGGGHTPSGTLASAGLHSHGGATGAGGLHSHGGGTGGTALTVARLAAHIHSINISPSGTGAGGGANFLQFLGGMNSNVTGSGSTHTHSISAQSAHTHTISTQAAHTHTFTGNAVSAHTHIVDPPYYALAFIQRTA